MQKKKFGEVKKFAQSTTVRKTEPHWLPVYNSKTEQNTILMCQSETTKVIPLSLTTPSHH